MTRSPRSRSRSAGCSRERGWRSRACVLALVALQLVPAGCYRWRTVSVAAVARGRQEIRTRRVRFTGAEGEVDVVVHRVHPSYLEGRERWTRAERRFSLEGVRSLQVREPNRDAAAMAAFGCALGVVYAVGMLVLFAHADGH